LQKTYPSVSLADQSLYENMQKTLKLARGKLDKDDKKS